MIYPIKGSNGENKELYDITYEDLAQLQKFDEGYYVEYKSAFNDSVKDKVPKIICSFANSAGGWLFIGANNDGTICNIQKERSDFSQTIEQLVSSNVSPLPVYDCRFVKDPNNSDQGVLIVQTQEGYEPPYISSGTVYIRSGSSTRQPEDWFEKARDSSTLRLLEEKRRIAEGKRLDFYKRELYFPPLSLSDNRPRNSFPFFNIYLYSPEKSSGWISAHDYDNGRVQLCKMLQDHTGWSEFTLQETPRSLIARVGILNSMDTISNTIELFRNGSIKAHIPMYLLQKNEREQALNKLGSLTGVRNQNLFFGLSAKYTLYQLMTCANVLDALIDGHPFCKRKKDYLLAMELEACEGFCIYSDNPYYDEYVKTHGIPFIAGSNCTQKDIQLRNYVDEGEASIASLAQWHLIEAMGFPALTSKQSALTDILKIFLGYDPKEDEPDILDGSETETV